MELKINDKVYNLRVDRKLLHELARWATLRLPDPLEAIKPKLNGFSKSHQEFMIVEAMREARKVRNILDPEIQGVLESEEGVAHQLREIYGELPPDELMALHLAAAKEHGAGYLGDLFLKALA